MSKLIFKKGMGSYVFARVNVHFWFGFFIDKNLMIKISERSFTLRFDDFMSSFSSEQK